MVSRTSLRMIALVAVLWGDALCEDVLDSPPHAQSHDIEGTAQYDSIAETSDDETSSDSKAGTFILGLSIVILTVGVTFAVFKCIRQCEQRDANRREEPPVSGRRRRIRIGAPRLPPPSALVDLEAPNSEASGSIRRRHGNVLELKIPGICGCGSVHVGVGVLNARNIPGTKEYKSPAIRRPSDFQPNAKECEKCEFEEKLEYVLANRVPPALVSHRCTAPASAAAGTGVGVGDGVGMGVGMGVGGLEKKEQEESECDYREERNSSDSGSGSGDDRFDMFPSSLGGQRALGGAGIGGYSPV